MTDAAAPWQRILLATEHTEFDAGAERLAIELAQRSGRPLAAVVPIATNAELLAEAPAIAARIDADAAARRAELLREAEAAGVAVDVRVGADADKWRAIVSAAGDARADLVVVRRRGHSGFLARMLVGEMAASVASHAPCDVLMVPRAARLWSGGVVAAVDDSPASVRVAATAASVAQCFALPLRLVIVATEATLPNARDSVQRALRTLEREGHAATAHTRVGRTADEIVAATAELGADLVVIGRHGASSALRRAVLGSTAKKVVGLASCPVLVVRT
jgi:hypothetical protein